MARHAAASARSEYILAPFILTLGKGAGRVKTATGKHNLSVKAGLRVLQRVDFDNSTHFPSIFGRNPGGVDTHRLHVIGFNLWPEARRAVVGEGYAVDHELCLIFRAPWVEDSISFIAPSRLRVHKILNRATRNGTDSILYRFCTHLADRTCLLRIDQGVGSA